MPIRAAAAALAILLSLLAASAGAVTVGSPTDEWNLVSYSASPDWFDDEAAGNDEADIVGDADHGALYTFFDDLGTASTTDGILGFRIRLGADDNPAGFKHVAAVGMDVDGDFAVDVMLVVDNKGGSPEIAIRPVDGDGTSPAQTGIDTNGGVSFAPTAANYDWQAVSVLSDPEGFDTDLDGDGKNDHFLSFTVDFQELVNQIGGTFDQSTAVALVAGTSTNSSSIKQDWVGPDGGVGSTSSWLTIGGFSQTMVIPESDTALLLGLGLAGLAYGSRRR